MLAEHYLLIKHTHIVLAVLSGSLFVLRGLWVLLRRQRVLSRISYAIDSALLLVALLLLATLNFLPLSMGWLQAKLFLLVLYVLFGALAFQLKYFILVRCFAYFAALLCFAGMYYSARLRLPFAGLFA